MKKRFTEKQIVSFRIFVEDGIIKQLSGYPVLLERIVSDLKEVDEGEIIYKEMNTNEIVNEYDARGEKGYLVRELIDSMDNKEKARFINSLAKDYSGYIDHKVDRKSMIQMLGLREYATKEEILKELDEIL